MASGILEVLNPDSTSARVESIDYSKKDPSTGEYTSIIHNIIKAAKKKGADVKALLVELKNIVKELISSKLRCSEIENRMLKPTKRRIC